MCGKIAEAGGNERQSTYNNQYQPDIFSVFLHKIVKFDAKIKNNYELCIINYELFRTFAPAICKNNIYLIN